jgi:hypothetical protein
MAAPLPAGYNNHWTHRFMPRNSSLDGTPLQRAPRRTQQTAKSDLFSDKELAHITKPPTPILVTATQAGKHIRRMTVTLGLSIRHGIGHLSSRVPSAAMTMFSFTKQSLGWLLANRRRIIALVIIVTISLYIAALNSRSSQRATENQTTSSSSTSSGDNTPVTLPKGTPDFKTVLPSGSSIDQLGGWTRVSPEQSAPVYAFNDKIGSVTVIVSQQALPDALRSDTSSKVKALASTYGPPERIMAGTTEVFISRSQSGPASVALTKSNLLIFIKTNDTISDTDLITYIKSLQ